MSGISPADMTPWPADYGDGGGPAEEAPPPGPAAKRARVGEDASSDVIDQLSGETTSPHNGLGAEADADSGGVELYCVCRQPDDDRSMIGCDGCEEWWVCPCFAQTLSPQ